MYTPVDYLTPISVPVYSTPVDEPLAMAHEDPTETGSLQQALLRHKKDFVKNSKKRVAEAKEKGKIETSEVTVNTNGRNKGAASRRTSKKESETKVRTYCSLLTKPVRALPQMTPREWECLFAWKIIARPALCKKARKPIKT